MLTPYDDFPLHQAPWPIDRVAVSDSNFYDRYYFNVHDTSCTAFLALGLGVYPNLGVMDAFAMGVDAIFDDQNLALDVIWRWQGEIPGVPVRVIRKVPEAIVGLGDNRYDLPALLIGVRLSEVADPQPGDLIQFVDEDNRVAEITNLGKIDSRGLVRTCEARYDEDDRFPTSGG